ncbi:unnamed protein product [Blepharisma stoltei]|uniref:DNA-(apurinic or apyrimidinic site) endonuclease n=1 Tax=Blepharisma stoltei TaxID=1481888 RepID=A0AAU9IUY8_9CILI|nr:unnamed protein product [Blepharisma stoltei]
MSLISDKKFWSLCSHLKKIDYIINNFYAIFNNRKIWNLNNLDSKSDFRLEGGYFVENRENIEHKRKEGNNFNDLIKNMKRRRTEQKKKPVKRLKKEEKTQIKIASWNVCGLRSMLMKDGIQNLIDSEAPNIICFNETRLQDKHIEAAEKLLPSSFSKYWNCSHGKKGYSGVAILTEVKPEQVIYGIGTERHDIEGRALTAEYKEFFLVNTYFPCAGRDYAYRTQQWDFAIRDYIAELQRKKPVIWCGDFNVINEDIDIYDIKGKEKMDCITDEERRNFHTTLEECKLVDTFRYLNPGLRVYSHYSRRKVNAVEKGYGWRVDYILVSEIFKQHIEKAYIRTDIYGSDHLPCILQMSI